ncbi:hypothetical protein NEF87_002957 [Candidatus Lokiarchaeum ossiferum]|uniref:Acyl-peptide hydrolase n=1 Tax=Candidatus Lokiarchaeum ossiferum TaxID=2951803 RepID=A0ABY6HWE1_9ARCH|nr:hypothetical protein NEF87_002957 [Candidatus Lokiarchaeum sp. B-35]
MIEPSIKDVQKLPIPSSISVSNDGSKIAYTLIKPNFKDNYYETHCYVYSTDSKKTIQLTYEGSISNIEWMDCDSLAFVYSNPSIKDEKPQVYLFKDLAGQPLQLTDHKSGITSFKFFEGGLLYLADDPDYFEERENIYGDLIHSERDNSASNIYYLNIPKVLRYRDELKLVDDKQGKKIPKPILDLKKYMNINRKIEGIVIPNSRSGKFIVNTRERDDLVFLQKKKSYLMNIDIDNILAEFLIYQENDDKDKEEKEIFGEFDFKALNLFEESSVLAFSPDDSKILIDLKIEGKLFYHQTELSVLFLDQLNSENLENIILKQCITNSFDHEPFSVKWVKSGIYLAHAAYSTINIQKFDLNGTFERIHFGIYSPSFEFSVSNDGLVSSYISNTEKYQEVAFIKEGKLEIITNLNKLIENWNLGSSESVKWKASDNLEIEGVLRKPSNFDPSKKYPLVFIVHGGPTSYSDNSILTYYLMRYYPAVQFLNRGIIVVEPNYRGSIGRGKAFMKKYAENIGFGDMDDLESAIDHLVKQGFVDENKIGCMGWSQGGYISAFVTTHSNRFVATSVGAGVSSWKTYYNSNDIRQWAVHYLGGTPLTNPEYYKKTAPMNNILNAKTPTLFQHGELDQRCPLPNATALNRALMELGVETDLFIIKGMPHGITKPRENMAVLHQNLKWFSHYLLGEALDWTE